MAHFKLIPIDRALDSIEFDAISAASVLDIAQRGALGETDVYCDGPYKFTISHGDRGVWTITQRKIVRDIALSRAARPAAPKVDLQALFCPQPETA